MTKKTILSVLLFAAVLFSGCGKNQIFIHEGDEYKLEGLTDEKLEEDTYYVKDNTTFYKVHEAKGNGTGETKKINQTRVLWTTGDDPLIPSMYSDGIIAYKSKDSSLENIYIERYKDIGWSLALYGAEIDASGYIKVSFQSDVVKDTSLYEALKAYKSYDIRIATINGESPKEMLDFAGVIENLGEGEEYELEFYAGTQFLEAKVKADTHFYQSYEMYYVESGQDTLNGYIAVSMPDGINSGFYNVMGEGLFKYYNTTKNAVPDAVDMNVAYYENEAEQISANSQAFVISVGTTTESITFGFEYATDVYSDDEIIAYLTAPDGEVYEMVANDGTASVVLDEAIAGRWTMTVSPKDLEIIKTVAEESETLNDAIKESYNVQIEEGNNILVTVSYDGTGEVWGTMRNTESNAAYEFKKEKGKITCACQYLPSGTYEINVYHYVDTEIKEPEVGYDKDATSEDIIIVEDADDANE